MMTFGEAWSLTGSTLASLLFVWAMYRRFFPYHVRLYLEAYAFRVINLVYPYVRITFHEYNGDCLKRSESYVAIQSYLGVKSSACAKRLKADETKGSKSLVLCMDDFEEISDEFNGVRLWWESSIEPSNNQSINFFKGSDDRRFYKLTFHKRHRKLITETYIEHVLKVGREVAVRNRQRKLYTNNSSQNWYVRKQTKWSNVAFEHPATFDTLAMDLNEKEEIKKDLIKFSKGKEYYKKIGKPWKRGYLLYGPPGTGKSTMISAMANFLNYDVYDLELTTVKDNSELKRLLLDTTNKSIIVIEDIDCSLDLTGQRCKKKKNVEEEDKERDPIEKKAKKELEKGSKVTLSGLLNAIDGLWSACSSEKIIVFTTNFVHRLDPALIRRGRMDKHIEMSDCHFEAFKILAKNYLDIESHALYEEIRWSLEDINVSPADVAEYLMPKSLDEDVDICLKRLVHALDEVRKKANRETKNKNGVVQVEAIEANT